MRFNPGFPLLVLVVVTSTACSSVTVEGGGGGGSEGDGGSTAGDGDAGGDAGGADSGSENGGGGGTDGGGTNGGGTDGGGAGEGGTDGGGSVECEEPTQIDGSIQEDTTWGSQGDGCTDYVVNGVPTVSSATLTIEPGTVVAFAENAGLHLSSDSVLIAEGDEGEEILLTGTQEAPGWWQAVHLSTSNSLNTRLDHVIIEYGGRDDGCNLALGTGNGAARMTLTRSVLRHSDGYGLCLLSNNAIISEFEGNVLTQNALGAATASTTTAHFFDDSSSYSGNDRDIISLSGDDVQADATWSSLGEGVRYRVDKGFTLTAALSIQPGTEVEFAQGARVRVNSGGAVIADGTEQAPILLTGVQAVDGFWRGIWLRESNSPDTVFDYVTIEYGGAMRDTGTASGNLVIGGSGVSPTAAQVSNSTFRHAGKDGVGYGLWADGNADINDDACQVNEFMNNEEGDCELL